MRPVFSCAAAAAATAADVVAEADDVADPCATIAGDLHLVTHHLVEADALDALDADVEATLIFARQESLRHDR